MGATRPKLGPQSLAPTEAQPGPSAAAAAGSPATNGIISPLFGLQEPLCCVGFVRCSGQIIAALQVPVEVLITRLGDAAGPNLAPKTLMIF